MIKKFLIGLALLVIIIGVGIVYVGSNLDSLIKAGIEKYATAATQATTTLDTVKISLSTGQGVLKGFVLGNPKGFKSDSAMRFGTVDVQLDEKSVMGKGPIVIKKVLIDAPELTYEVMKDGSSNLQKILDNVKAYAAQLSPSQPSATPQKEEPAASSKQEERKLIVEQLVISNGRVKLSHELLAGKNLVDAQLPSIQMANIGKNSNGITAAGLAETILQKLSQTAITVGQSNLVTELRKQGIESLKGAVENSGVGKAIGNIFGK